MAAGKTRGRPRTTGSSPRKEHLRAVSSCSSPAEDQPRTQQKARCSISRPTRSSWLRSAQRNRPFKAQPSYPKETSSPGHSHPWPGCPRGSPVEPSGPKIARSRPGTPCPGPPASEPPGITLRREGTSPLPCRTSARPVTTGASIPRATLRGWFKCCRPPSERTNPGAGLRERSLRQERIAGRFVSSSDPHDAERNEGHADNNNPPVYLLQDRYNFLN